MEYTRKQRKQYEAMLAIKTITICWQRYTLDEALDAIAEILEYLKDPSTKEDKETLESS